MALSRRRIPSDPADVYRLHAEEARAARDSAVTDEARTHYDYAAVCHDTAARLLSRTSRLTQTAVQMRGLASNARLRRMHAVGQFYDGEANKREIAAAVSPNHAERYHLMGMERSAVAREHEQRALEGVKIEDGESPADALYRHRVDVYAKEVAKRMVAEEKEEVERRAAELQEARSKRNTPSSATASE